MAAFLFATKCATAFGAKEVVTSFSEGLNSLNILRTSTTRQYKVDQNAPPCRGGTPELANKHYWKLYKTVIDSQAQFLDHRGLLQSPRDPSSLCYITMS